MTPGDRLANLLKRMGSSKYWLTRQCGVNEKTVRRWTNGALPVPERVVRWVAAMEKFLDYNPVPICGDRIYKARRAKEMTARSMAFPEYTGS